MNQHKKFGNFGKTKTKKNKDRRLGILEIKKPEKKVHKKRCFKKRI
jgi:hypothetical protein